MPRLIFKCPYVKGGSQRAAAHLSNYVRYMATREGAQKFSPDQSWLPATEKQRELVEQLLRDFPLSRGTFEYEDYAAAPTRGNASEFITRVLEDNYDRAAKKENYVQYIASRPRAQRTGTHALFTGSDETLTLSQVAEEVANHTGNVWLPILSLRREDAARLGYDDANQWKVLLTGCAIEMAQAMKIPWDQFRWYAAFHDESHHPHVHMVCYSADGKSGYLTKQGIAQIKSGLAKEIFRNELTELYREQTQRRDTLNSEAAVVMETLVHQMETGTLENPRMEQLMEHLAGKLKNLSGKKQYGYLKAPLKAVVDEIVDELARDPRVAQAYDLWYEMREEVLRTYKDELPERLPLSRQKEFKAIRNLVIREAVRLGELRQVFHPEDQTEAADPDGPEQETGTNQNEGSEETGAPPPMWEWRFRRAWAALQDHASSPEQVAQALEEVIAAAEAGYRPAQYRLGKLLLQGERVPKDAGAAVRWLTAAAEQGDQYAQYALGKLYLLGLEVPEDRERARLWFQQSAEQGNQYAQYFLTNMDSRRLQPVAWAVSNLLYHIAGIFREQEPRQKVGAIRFTDKKLRQKIREKKIAMGHKPDDHEEQTVTM